MLKAWQVMENAIPRGMAEDLAEHLGVSTNLIIQMKREPTSDESPTATGRTSWLERMAQLIDALVLVNPDGAALIVEWMHHYYLRRVKIAGRIPARDRHETASQCLAECAEAVNQINNGASRNEAEVAILRAQDALTRALLSLHEGKE